MEPETPGKAAATPRPLWSSGPILLAAGLALFLGYCSLEISLPKGIAEFAYWPPLMPLPFAAMRGFTFEQLAGHLVRLLVLGPSLVLLGLGLVRLTALRPPSHRTLRRLTLAACGVGLVLTAWVMGGILRGRPIVDDELAYHMQALLLAQGRLGETTVPPWGEEPFTIWTMQGATGKYLFGEPLVQLAGSLFGLPALMHLLLGALTLLLWQRLVEREAGAEVALWSTILLALSPMVILTTATGMSHATSLACVVAAGYGYVRIKDSRPWSGAFLVGTALGFGFAVRPQVLAPAGMVIGLVAGWHLVRRRQLGPSAVLLLSGCVWLLLIALYNSALSGSPWTLPWHLAQPTERYGFGAVSDASPYVHTLGKSFANLLVSTVRFNAWWLGWPLGLAFLGLWLFLRRPGAKPSRVWLAVGGAILLFHLPYYSPGVSDTGPVYYYELILPAALLGGHTLVAAFKRWPRATTALLTIHLGLGTTTFLYKHISRLDRLVTAIHTPAEYVLEQLEPPALLIIETAGQESLHSGWVFSFPARYRRDSDPIVTYPLGHPDAVPLLRQRYAERKCWYYRVHPETLEHQVLSCERAEPLMARPRPLRGRPLWLRLPPTAVRKGLMDPFAD